MSWQATSWVIEHSEHKGSALLTLLCIANCANSDGSHARPGMTRLAKDTRMSRRQVVRIIEKLEASGELTIKRRDGVENSYSMPLVTSDKMSRVKKPTTRDTIMSPTRDIAMAPDPKDSKILNTPSLSPSRSYRPKTKPAKPLPEPKIKCPENILELSPELRELCASPERDMDTVATQFGRFQRGQPSKNYRTLEQWSELFQYWLGNEKPSGNGKGNHESASERNVRYIRESLADFPAGELSAFPENGNYQGPALLLAASSKS